MAGFRYPQQKREFLSISPSFAVTREGDHIIHINEIVMYSHEFDSKGKTLKFHPPYNLIHENEFVINFDKNSKKI